MKLSECCYCEVVEKYEGDFCSACGEECKGYEYKILGDSYDPFDHRYLEWKQSQWMRSELMRPEI